MTKKTDPSIRDFDLTPVAREFWNYAPAYAKSEARQAIERVQELQIQGFLRNGVYYVVLSDIVGATRMAAKIGNEAMAQRIEFFVRHSLIALSQIQLVNVGVFLKEIGDAVLFVFAHFPDILRWHDSLRSYLNVLNDLAWKDDPLKVRTVIHVGEVHLSGVNPISLAVSQLFKVEKTAKADEIVLTQSAFAIAWPTLARAYHAFEAIGDVDIEGFMGKLPLYRLRTSEYSPPSRIADESHG
jgi:class 3 adenylate cyclase